jgi:hypothetical protein
MSWQLTVHNEPRIIEACYTGVVSSDELFDSITSTIACAREHQIFLLLADCRTFEGGHDVADLKRMAQFLISSNVNAAFKEAMLVPAQRDASNNIYFWSFLSQANGLNIKPFEHRQYALDWLLDPDS